jgi:hypothetical protein
MADDDLYRQGDSFRVQSVDLEGVRSVIAVPLVSGQEAIGVLTLYRRCRLRVAIRRRSCISHACSVTTDRVTSRANWLIGCAVCILEGDGTKLLGGDRATGPDTLVDCDTRAGGDC